MNFDKCPDETIRQYKECVYPHYGKEPHRSIAMKIEINGSEKVGMGSMPFDKSEWPENYKEDPECEGLGTYSCPFGEVCKIEINYKTYRCPKCNDISKINPIIFYNSDTYCHKCNCNKIEIEGFDEIWREILKTTYLERIQIKIINRYYCIKQFIRDKIKWLKQKKAISKN